MNQDKTSTKLSLFYCFDKVQIDLLTWPYKSKIPADETGIFGQFIFLKPLVMLLPDSLNLCRKGLVSMLSRRIQELWFCCFEVNKV